MIALSMIFNIFVVLGFFLLTYFSFIIFQGNKLMESGTLASSPMAGNTSSARPVLSRANR